MYPESVQKLIEHFKKLPGVGPKTAERFVFHILGRMRDTAPEFGESLKRLDQVSACQICQNYADRTPCRLCSDPGRAKDTICVVSRPQDVMAIEKTGSYRGAYHVLGGVLNPIEGITPDQLAIKQLVGRIRTSRPAEIILALNPDMEGDATSLYLIKLLKPMSVRLTRLARGLPLGSDLEYADEVTLTDALKGRRDA